MPKPILLILICWTVVGFTTVIRMFKAFIDAWGLPATETLTPMEIMTQLQMDIWVVATNTFGIITMGVALMVYLHTNKGKSR